VYFGFPLHAAFTAPLPLPLPPRAFFFFFFFFVLLFVTGCTTAKGKKLWNEESHNTKTKKRQKKFTRALRRSKFIVIVNAYY